MLVVTELTCIISYTQLTAISSHLDSLFETSLLISAANSNRCLSAHLASAIDCTVSHRVFVLFSVTDIIIINITFTSYHNISCVWNRVKPCAQGSSCNNLMKHLKLRYMDNCKSTSDWLVKKIQNREQNFIIWNSYINNCITSSHSCHPHLGTCTVTLVFVVPRQRTVPSYAASCWLHPWACR